MIRLTELTEGQRLVYGGDRVSVVPADLARAFVAGDRLVIVQDTGDLLHIPRAEHQLVAAAVTEAVDAFGALAACDDDQITDFFERFAGAIDDDATFSAVLDANRADVEAASSRGRSTTRLQLSPAMRSDMAAGLRSWSASTTRASSSWRRSITGNGRCRRGGRRSVSSGSSSRDGPTCSPMPQGYCAPATPPCSGSGAMRWARRRRSCGAASRRPWPLPACPQERFDWSSRRHTLPDGRSSPIPAWPSPSPADRAPP